MNFKLLKDNLQVELIENAANFFPFVTKSSCYCSSKTETSLKSFQSYDYLLYLSSFQIERCVLAMLVYSVEMSKYAIV